jgi:AraC family transcriptional regulator
MPNSPAPDVRNLATAIGRRFHRPPAPSAIACLGSHDPVLVSHIVSDRAMPAPTLPPPPENAFALHVHHTALRRSDIWIDGRHRRAPLIQEGGVMIFDLRSEPVAQVHEPFEFSRFQISRPALDDLAYEHGLRRLGDLRADTGDADPVLQHLALAMRKRAAVLGHDRDTLFTDGIALAFFAHVAQKYAGAADPPGVPGMLAAWQVRRIRDYVNANLHQPISIGELAALVGLSRSHFSRLFLKSFGLPPHRWLLNSRVERAKQMLGDAASLAEISASCGFTDQSHFTRWFARVERMTPGHWRRRMR